MKRLFALLLLGPALAVSLAGQEVAERIEILGNDRVSRETVLYYLSVREGERFSDEQLQRDFRVLWSTGFFSNIKIEDLPGTQGRVIRITVEENPVIKTVTYKTGKRVKQNDIVNKLKEKDENILAYSYYSPNRVQRVKQTIQDLLAEKGLLAASIETEVKKAGRNEVELLVKIDEGPKLRVADVVFEGDTRLPPNYLRWSMKDNRPHSLFNWIAGKDVYKQNKLGEDLERIKKKLQENGYMEAVVEEPRMEQVEKRTVLFKKQKMVRLVVPVKTGHIYRTGEVKVEGNKAFNAKGLMTMIRLQPGEIYSTKYREKSIEDIAELYRNFGYLYIQVMPVENLDPRKKVVNVVFNVNEGEVAYLHRLEFRGNTFTKDKVIRREMLLREGDRFSLAAFKNSILRVKQLGLVDIEKDPDILPDPEDPTKINVKVNVKELQRNNIQFTAGYSGYEGTFVAFSYSTVNFLGAGESLEVMLQQGKLVKNYMFSFTEPYVFDKPVTTGLSLFNRRYSYPGLYNQRMIGGNLLLGARIFGYWRSNLTYTLQKVEAWLPEGSPLDPNSPNYDPYYGYMFYGSGKYYQSSLTPMIYYSTVDSPLTPSRGTMVSAMVKYSGTFLGGDIDLVKPEFEFSRYQPFVKKHVLGFHIAYQFIKSINHSKVPYWEKFYLGGERSIRGYDVYTIGPRSSSGAILGGDKALYMNAEYIIPVGGPLYGIFFYDAGNALATGQKFSLRNMYSSAGFEARIFVPALRVPFRLIFSYNNRKILESESNFAFRFAVGTTF